MEYFLGAESSAFFQTSVREGGSAPTPRDILKGAAPPHGLPVAPSMLVIFLGEKFQEGSTQVKPYPLKMTPRRGLIELHESPNVLQGTESLISPETQISRTNNLGS